MLKNLSSHQGGVLLALFVTFLWATSWVLIKIGLREQVPALTFAGLRYVLAFLCLLPLALRSGNRASLRALSAGQWQRLAALGLLFVAVTQGAQFLALALLPAVTVSLLLSFSPVAVALLGVLLLSERPTVRQWAGVLLVLLGVLVYFYPVLIPAGQEVGLAVVAVGVLANAGSAVLGRSVNGEGRLSPLLVTVVSMGVGSVALLLVGLATQGVPTLSPLSWGIIAWLAVVNTALAFPLWNHTLRVLSAVESSVINNTMLAQIAILAWLFLGEELTGQKLLGLGLAGVGTLIVQVSGVYRGVRGQGSGVRIQGW
ncbi:MAG: DMT family transporter [Chloroflexia bacterium]